MTSPVTVDFMRASRLLHILLLLQNRGRLTSSELASELEVTPRTILRDIDALTEAGLPVITYQGNRGGFELGFNYRTRLTGLDEDEAEALGVWLSDLPAVLVELGMGEAAARASRKLIESFPDGVRHKISLAQHRFRIDRSAPPEADPRIASFAIAIRDQKWVQINARSKAPTMLRPTALALTVNGWSVVSDAAADDPIPIDQCGDVNIRLPPK